MAESGSHTRALKLSQDAPRVIERQSGSSLIAQLPFLGNSETPELWTQREQVLLSCLRTGDDKSALQCLEQLIGRFGSSNERVMALQGIYQEAVATDDEALAKVLNEYEDILSRNPTNMPISKRRIALLQTLGRPKEAINAAVELLDASPTDAETWSELSDLYLSHSSFPQAIFCLEEVLLILPNAWNVHARIGEVYLKSGQGEGSDSENAGNSAYVAAIRYYSRSLELCDGYLRALYGLFMATQKYLANVRNSKGNADAPSRDTIQKLHEIVRKRLEKIAQTSPEGKEYSKGELRAIKELLQES
ncbi:hypothetical protein MMC25_007096 [Agyrium rufum]|nr:hypothetical protein [Agyrium rufum]